ncbi:hypothetical protein F442_01137 [Phytophthora nicotianae P10297]|uniref:RING-type domain-containing protein n=1 Tax=Phytophthora nicotianae P10297 TaxID=1317064 RepID=W3A315_PHYNI|nr:hypothetical protein F442_01137 [Phytophthora nicotianae P10297]
MMSRLVPYRTKVSEEVATRIEQTLNTTMYLVQTTGPTSYVIQEQNCDKKYKVLIGPLQTCSCGTADICIHILFVMLKVLRVPPTTPVVWQKSLIDSEIETLLRGGYREKSRPAPKPYMKKRKEAAAPSEPEDVDVDRHELVAGEVCAICQEDMDDSKPLTFCRKGCGNNFHIECMKVFGESRRQSKENIICPLCRQDWGGEALTALRKAIDAANRAPNVHKGALCRKCKTKPIRCERYRCVRCKNVDLCARCFKSNAHLNHAFVMKQNVSDPWIPALRENQPRTAISSDLIRDLESRELSTNDYDVLLQLDHGDKRPIQDYLVKVISGSKVSADSAKTFGEPGATCSLCAQNLRIKAALHSTLCGHVFHESCLARSMLSQVYVCPFPGCDYALLPGLLYLQQKHEKSKSQQLTEPKQEPQAPPTLNASFTVLGLQKQQQSHIRSPRITRLRALHAHITKRQHSRRESDELPLLPDLVSVGITPDERSSTDLPALSQRASMIPAPVPNQLEHENIESQSSSRTSTAERPKLRAKGKLAEQLRTRNILPPLPTFQSDSNETETRLNHAERVRAELKAVKRERLQTQRLLKEERRQRHQEQNNTPAFTNGFLGANQKENDPMATVHVTLVQRNVELKRKSKERQQRAREHKHLPSTLPDLFVGNMSK